MKKFIALFAILLLGFSACSKKGPSAVAPPYDINGVKVDIPKLQQAFANSPPELQASANEASSFIRYGQYMKTLEALDKLVNAPGIDDNQKKVVNEVIEQMKQVINKSGPSRQ